MPPQSFLLMMAGLPGSGKTAISKLLAPRINALRLDKDAVRDLVFPPTICRHDRALNDFCMELLFTAAKFAIVERNVQVVILDGRPFTLATQRSRACAVASDVGARPLFIHCTAPLEVLRSRIEATTHVARDRDAALLNRLAAEFETFAEDVIDVDTSSHSIDGATERVVTAVRTRLGVT